MSTRLGAYELLRELSRGGMGEVWLAKRHGSHGFERIVALKTIRKDLRNQDRSRVMFLDEARVLSMMHHPAVAQVFDFGEEDGRLYLAMEYVAGLSFARLVAAHAAELPPAIAVRLLVEALRGLHAAHEARAMDGRPLGVVHRDVSPQNLILSFEGQVKVIDFGIAVAEDRLAADAAENAIVGKPAYMAPEQLRSSHGVDRRADVFSAAVVLHELLAKRRLFYDRSIPTIVEAVRTRPIPALGGPDIPPELDAICQRGLQRDRTDRFASAADMADALEALLPRMGGEPLRIFAERVMSAERAQHDALLRGALASQDVATPAPSFPEALGTMVATGRAFSDGAEEVDPTVSENGAPTATAPPERPIALESAASALESRPVPTVGVLENPAARLPLGLALGAGLIVIASAVVIGRSTSSPAPRPPTESAALASPPASSPAALPTSTVVAAPVSPDPRSPAPSEKAPVASESPRPKRPRAPSPSELAAPAPSSDAPRPTETTPPTQDLAKGRVIVAARPWAEVWIDGRYVDKTPLSTELPVGSHALELKRPDTSEVRDRRTITVSEGATVRVLVE